MMQAGLPAPTLLRRATVGCAMLLPFMLPGCSFSDDRMASAFIDPAAYLYYSCDQLEALAKGSIQQQKTLDGYIKKAEQGTGGKIIATTVYGVDYLNAVGNQRLIEQTAKDKSCPVPESAPPR
jgi:hypothetical protein